MRLLGVSDRTFARLESEGVIRALAAGKGRRQSVYDAPRLVSAYLGHMERKLRASNESPRDRRDRSQAELYELRLARERRGLLPRDQVVLAGQAFVKAVVAKLRALPSTLLRAGAIQAPAVAAVEQVIREAQEEMARWRMHPSLGGDAKDGEGA